MTTWDDKPNDYEHALREISRLSAEVKSAQAVCDSYALENQQFSDRIDRLQAALEEIAQNADLGGRWCAAYAQGALANEQSGS